MGTRKASKKGQLRAAATVSRSLFKEADWGVRGQKTLPTKFQFLLGAQEWTAELVEKVDNDDSFGECVNAKSHIRVRRDLTADQTRDTLLHEIIHAGLHISGVSEDINDKLEERIVRALAPFLDDALEWKLRRLK